MLCRTLTLVIACFAAVSVAAQQNVPAPAAAPDANYVIGARDVLVITSYDQQDLSGKFSVDADGSFTYPMLGRVDASGLTFRQLEATLKARLVVGGFFKDPQITVGVDQYRSRKIFVLGEVRQPGVHALSGTMRLVEALALADSTLPTAGSQVVIIPAGDDSSRPSDQNVRRISLDSLEDGDASQNIVLRDGDTILVPRAEEVYVFGQVKTPGAYSLQNEDMTVLQALSLAGGVTDRGSMGRIEIVRLVEGARKEIRAELGDPILPGDTIIVPERFF